MARGNVYGQSSGGLKVNDVEKTTAVIKTGNNINIGDLISYDGNEVTKRSITNDISSGNEYVFNSGTIVSISAVSLSDTKVLVSYRNISNSNYGVAIVLNIDSTNITSGSEYIFNSGITYYISAVSLTDSKVLVSYGDGGNYQRGTAIVLNIDGNTITSGSEYVFNSDITRYISTVSLTDTKVLVSYKDSGNNDYGTAIVLNISGNVITKGSEFVFNSGDTTYINTISLSDSKVLVSYRDGGNNNYGTSIILNISGTNITSGSEYIFNSDTTYYISAVSLSDTKVFVSYQDISNYGTAVIFTVSGNNIIKGSEYIFNNSGITSYISAVSLTDTKVLVSYSDGGNNYYGTAIVLNIDGNTITSGSEYVFNSGTTNDISAVKISDSKIFIGYSDSGNNDYGTSIVLDLTKTNIEGLALKSGTGGETIDIYKF